MQKIKSFPNKFWVTILFLFLAAPLFAEDIYSAYKKDFETFKQAVQQEYDNFKPLQIQYPEYFRILEELQNECKSGNFHTEKFDSLIAEHLYQKTQIQSQNQSSLVFGFVAIALFGVVFVLLLIIYFIFVNEQHKQRIVMSAIINEIEKERSRISRELHDSVAQNLRASSISQDTAQKTELEMKAISDIRSICFNLNPLGLEEQGLDISIKELCSNFQKQNNIETNLFIDENIDFANKKFSAENKINIYRIIQESLNNAQKHSKSDSVSVTIQQLTPPSHPKSKFNQKIAIEISDDGIGFYVNNTGVNSISNAAQEKHFGINSMQQRAKILDGTLSIISQKDCGTVVRLEI